HCFWRFQLLLDRRSARPFFQTAERTVRRQWAGGLPWLPEGGREAGAVRGGEGAGAEGQRLNGFLALDDSGVPVYGGAALLEGGGQADGDTGRNEELSPGGLWG